MLAAVALFFQVFSWQRTFELFNLHTIVGRATILTTSKVCYNVIVAVICFNLGTSLSQHAAFAICVTLLLLGKKKNRVPFIQSRPSWVQCNIHRLSMLLASGWLPMQICIFETRLTHLTRSSSSCVRARVHVVLLLLAGCASQVLLGCLQQQSRRLRPPSGGRGAADHPPHDGNNNLGTHRLSAVVPTATPRDVV